jgi:glucosamine-phosphate N-acetyltransferase
MTTNIKYNKLSVLIERFPKCIQIIKDSYLELLSELTEVTKLDTPKFLENIQKISQIGTIIVCFVENPSIDGFKIVASGTIIIEPKIIHGGKNVGHIEDVVVKTSYRGFNISQDILDLLIIEAREKECYKVILDCKAEIKKVYTKSGFEENGVQMALYLKNKNN